MLEEMIEFLRSRGKATLALLAAHMIVFLVLSVMGSTQSTSFMLQHGACYTPLILEGEYYRLFTGMFLHFGLIHLVYNMICLVALGDLLEKEAGSWRYLAVYLLGGLAGNLVSLALDLYGVRGAYAVSAGASGAVFAVIGGVLWIVIRRKGQFGRISLQRMMLTVVLMVLQGFTQGGTDNAAHVGGLAAGFVLAALLQIR